MRIILSPLNDSAGYETANRREFPLDAEFSGPEEAERIKYGVATDGKNIINYPARNVRAKLYHKGEEMGIEKF